MSLHLSTATVPDAGDSDRSSSDEDEDDQNWDEWISDSALSKTLSLFENKQFPSVTEALEYDKSTHGFDLNETCSRLCLSSRNECTVLFDIVRVQRSISINVFVS